MRTGKGEKIVYSNVSGIALYVYTVDSEKINSINKDISESFDTFILDFTI